MKRTLTVAALLTASALGAQAPAPPTMSGALQRSFTSVATFLIQSAELMPEDKYSFRATEDTRTFSQEIGHIAAIVPVAQSTGSHNSFRTLGTCYKVKHGEHVHIQVSGHAGTVVLVIAPAEEPQRIPWTLGRSAEIGVPVNGLG